MKRIAKFTLVLFCLFSAMKVSAQYTITPVPPPPSFTFNDLWHFTVIRSSTDAYNQFYVSLRIFDGQSQLKVKSNTATLNLPAGTHYYNLGNISDLQPFVTSYYDGGFLQQVISTGGVFPAGTYNMVYTLYGKAADGEFEPLFEDNYQAVVEAMWPPMLLSPLDGDTIETQYPVLTWTPAFSSSYFGLITYTLTLKEVFPGQNKFQAFQSNPVYFSENNIPVTMLNYPGGAQALDTGHTYVWQVQAEGSGSDMGSSEIWEFSIGEPEPEPIDSVRKVYFEITRTVSSHYVVIRDGVLRIKFEERHYDIDEKLMYKIFDSNRQLVADQTQLTKYSQQGNNLFSISLCDNSTGFNLAKDNYTIEIRSQKGSRFYLNFFNDKTLAECAE